MITPIVSVLILVNSLSQLKTGSAIWAVYDFTIIGNALLLISGKNEGIHLFFAESFGLFTLNFDFSSDVTGFLLSKTDKG